MSSPGNLNPPPPATKGRGRAFLIAGQSADGSWPETTRPPGAIR